MKKHLWIWTMVCCLFGLMPGALQAAETQGAVHIAGDPAKFPVAFNRATGDTILSIAADDKGTIMLTTFDYLNVTRDYGKSWVSYRMPTDEMQSVHYAKGKFYLASTHVDQPDSVTHAYESVDGKQWIPFSLSAGGQDEQPRTIENVQYLNGRYVMLAKTFDTGTVLYTSSNGMDWNVTAAIPADLQFLTWNGSVYSAFGGGYTFYDKPKASSRNQFMVDSGDKRYAEMIVYSSSDLQSWSMVSGSVKSNLNYTFTFNGVPSVGYYYQLEQPVADGVISLFDEYGNRLTSKDGKTFTVKSIKSTLNSTFDRSPLFKIGKNEMIFVQYWYSSGVVRSKLLTSTDGVHWRTTLLDKSLPNGMRVIQAGTKLIGYGDDHKVAISGDGLHWTRIR